MLELGSMVENKKLNKEQLQAVKYKSGPLLIIAGAGTGKTTVITERIKFLLSKKIAKPNEILALTFTEKAAREMEERADLEMPYGYTQMWISTFHSFCDRVLRREILHIGFNPAYKLYSEADTIKFIKDNLFKFDLNYFRPLGNPTKFIEGLKQHFSRLQDEDITPTDYVGWVGNKRREIKGKSISEEEKFELEKWKELAGAYKFYEELKINAGVFDFGDLITKTLKLFRERKNILKEYKKQFKYILVDEFQDTNVAQYELLKLLANPKENPNLTAVGDDSQSIYKFRGAAISNILHFKKDYKKAKTIVLIKNYRSTQTILDSAYNLIRFNNPDTLETKLGINKNLVSERKTKKETDIIFIHKDRVENEAEEVAKQVTKLISYKDTKSINEDLLFTNHHPPYTYRDIAILVRANNHSEPFQRAFQRAGIPYQFLGPGRLFRQPEIVELISYMKFLTDVDDNVAFFKVLSIEHFGIAGKDLVRLGSFAKRNNISLYEACLKIDDPLASGQMFLSFEAKEKIRKVLSVIEKNLSQVKKETAGQIIYNFLTETDLIKDLLNPDSPYVQRKAANISKLFDKLKTFETDHEDASIFSVVEWIELSSEIGESPLSAEVDWTASNAVNILTVHSAKGLEFPAVFLVNLVSQRFPTMERREIIPIPDELIKEVLPEGDFHLQEERRLFYVGMTRAKDTLFLTAADYYGEGKREKKLSPYIFEALGEKLVFAEAGKDKGNQLSFLDYQTPKFNLQPISYDLQPFHVDYLSYSQIETFRICPLHYKLKYIFRFPTPPTSSQSFGNSFHATMKAFYENIKKGEKPTIALLYKGLKENWINAGYLGKVHEEKSFEKAKGFLKYYYKNIFDPKTTPVVMEQPFTVKIDNLSVGGKIDRIDIYKDGVEIIDYKTGATPLTQKQADDDLQLSIYALAATEIPEFPFNRDPEKVKLSLMYFDNPQIVTTSRTKKQLMEAKEKILDYKKQIEESDYSCSGSILCKTCEYKLLCQSQPD